jgi:hypothetical protein
VGLFDCTVEWPHLDEALQWADLPGKRYASCPHTVGNHPRLVNYPYVGMKNIGLNYGPVFQGLKACSALPNGVTASATLSPQFEAESRYKMHPTTIDHCLQSITVVASDGRKSRNRLLIVSIRRTEAMHTYWHQSHAG